MNLSLGPNRHRLAKNPYVWICSPLRLCTETLAQYVLYWLTRMEPLPEAEREAAHALGKRRYDHFVEQVAMRLVKQ